MFIIDNQSRTAVYEQIVSQAERLMLTGLLGAHDPLPSVRSLSVELSINPNTIQKAYSVLAAKQLIYVISGKGSFVCEDARSKLAAEKLGRLAEIENAARECCLAGIEKELLYRAVDSGYNSKGGVVL